MKNPLGPIQKAPSSTAATAFLAIIPQAVPTLSNPNTNGGPEYVAYDYLENHWEIGEIDRTCGVDRGVFNNPIWADASGNTYNQEMSASLGHGSYTVFAESGPISLAAGDKVMKVTSLIPDEKNQGDVTVTFKTRFYPNASESSFGPFSMANPTDVRFTGRQIRMRVEGNVNTDWRAGIMRIEAKAGGKR